MNKMNYTTRHINKFALLLLILYAISIGINMTSNLLLDFVVPGYPAKDVVTIQLRLLSLLFYLFEIIVNIGCGIWLFFESKNEKTNIWLWLFVGFFTGIFGVIVWFLKEILKEMKEKK
jgi:hypothetical protein